jgi:hypothetical protein
MQSNKRALSGRARTEKRQKKWVCTVFAAGKKPATKNEV